MIKQIRKNRKDKIHVFLQAQISTLHSPSFAQKSSHDKNVSKFKSRILKINYNRIHDTLELFHSLSSLSFNTSEMDHHYLSNKSRM